MLEYAPMQERNNGHEYDFVDADQLVPLGQFREWIEKPENLNFWMQYPASPSDELAMRGQVHEVLTNPGEASPTVIFNVAIKSAELALAGSDDSRNDSYSMLRAYRDGLTALSRSNKFSIQEHGHYWNTLTTLMNSQSLYVQRLERRLQEPPTGRRPAGR